MTMKHLLLKPRFLLGLALLVSALITSCGGGSQASKFQPQRVVAMGDEYSYIATDAHGTKYTVNYIDDNNLTLATEPYPCAVNPVWVQLLAAQKFSIAFPGCKANLPSAVGVMRAQHNFKTQDVINDANAWNDFRDGDLVTILVGAHDILDAYGQYDSSGTSVATLRAQLKATGIALGQWIYQTSQQHGGIRILVVTVPDLGLSPFAVHEVNKHGGNFVNNRDPQHQYTFYDNCVQPANDAGSSTRQEVLGRLTSCFNAGLRVGIIKADGRFVGLVSADQMTHEVTQDPGGHGFDDATNSSCIAGVTAPNCAITINLPTGSDTTYSVDKSQLINQADVNQSINRYFWAYDADIWLSPGGHAQLYSRASNQFDLNPF